VQEFHGDWIYDEYADGGYIAQLGLEPGNPPSIVVAPRPGEEPASAAADGNAGTALQPTSPGAVLLPPVAPQAPAQPAPRAPASTPTQEPYQRLAPALR
jgi:hypothetical protein